MTLLIKYLHLSLKRFLHLCFIFSIAGTFLGLFSRTNFISDIFSHFCIQYFLIGFAAIFYFFFAKKFQYLIIACLITIMNVIPLFQNINIHFCKSQTDMKVGLINVLTQNKNYDKVRKDLNKNSPDIIVIEELDDKWSRELFDIKKDYPYTYEISREDNFGIAIYSRIPIVQLKRINAGELETPAISVMCDYKGEMFEIIAIHTTPPISQDYFKNTRQMLENLAAYINSTNNKTIVIGDINSSFFSYNYKNFVKKAGLKDSGSIFKPTWSAFHPLPMRISLDHIFVTNSFDIKSFKRGKNVGSDHFPVYAELAFKK